MPAPDREASRAAAAPVRSGGVATDRSPEFSLPLRYFLLAIGAYVAATAGMLAFGSDLTGSVWHPRVLGLTHVLTLGTIVGMIMGASYQLIPVVLLVPLWSPRLGKATFWVFLAGVIAMVAGFWGMTPAWLGIGAALAGTSIASFLVNVVVSLSRGARLGLVGAFVLASLAFLGAAVTLGMSRALGYAHPALALAIRNPVAIHAHLAAFGGAAMLVFGVSYRLIPMFAVSSEGDRRGAWVLGLGVAGMLSLTLGLLGAAEALVRAGALVIAAGCCVWMLDVRGMFGARIRKQLDVGLAYVVTTVGWLGLATVLGLALAWGAVPAWIGADRLAIAYALCGLIGFIGFSILGQFYKIMPFLAWYHRYSALVGKVKVPLIRDIYDMRLGWGGFWSSQAGLLLGVVSVLAGLGLGVRLAGLMLALGAIATGTMVLQTLRR
ncbi:MAG TPA: hypothetical protein V6D00_08225 [Pantanalinema sp.]